ncbi:MAG TPA: hypothetical protein VFM35_11690 [Candidatus Binatia bacterium]|nr:hypothetical protein [Candidatus Binatia bacterium]
MFTKHLKVGTFTMLLLMAGGCTAELFTSPLVFNQKTIKGFEAMDCRLVNVSGVPRSGEINIVRLDGQPMSSGNYNNVAPGGGTGISVSTFPPPVSDLTPAYCKVTVEGTKGTIRAALMLRDADGNTIAVSEAR